MRKDRGISATGALALALAVACAAARADVPPPSALRAKVIVNGRTSTAIDIPIAKVGQEIPATYAGREIANTPGFEFYVSEHFALKSNMGDDYSRMVLEVSELAHPHWVALVGAEPPDPDRRMYVTYADTKETLLRAMTNDRGHSSDFGGGGITLFSNGSAYNFPSGTLKYHQRALVIHENLHMLNMVTNGTGGTEGPTYAGEQHVYDPEKRQLTVLCFDKAPTNNYTDTGLTELRKQFVPMEQAVRTLWRGGDGRGAMYQQFFLTDPDRCLKWRIWRDEFYAGNVTDETNAALMESIHGPLEQLNEEWARWVRDRRATFHYVEWGWEQDGNALWAYGFPKDEQFWSQTDLLVSPGERPAHDPLRMDYPTEPMPPIVGPVERGVAEPSVGCVVGNLQRRAWGGMGFGVEDRGMCQVIIVKDESLVIDGSSLGLDRQEQPLTPLVRAAAMADGGRYGLTIRIAREAVVVTLRAGVPGAIAEQTASVPLDTTQRQRLLDRPMAVIGKDGWPRVTPWFDDAREPWPDLSQSAPANRWRFAGLDRLETLYRAAWRLGEKAPQSLRTLKSEMLLAVDARPQAQAEAVEEYEDRIVGVVRDVKRCSADAATKARALADLAGVFIHVAAVHPAGNSDAVQHRVTARLDAPVTCRVSYTPGNAGRSVKVEPSSEVTLVRHRPAEFTASCRPATDGKQAAETKVAFTLRWRGETIVVNNPQKPAGPKVAR